MTEEEILLEFKRFGVSEGGDSNENEFVLDMEKCSILKQIPFYQTDTTAE